MQVAAYINPHSAGIDFSRQNLTSVDVRFWRLKSIPALWDRTVRVKIFIMAENGHNIGFQMNREELTNTFMMISNWKKPFGLHGYVRIPYICCLDTSILSNL